MICIFLYFNDLPNIYFYSDLWILYLLTYHKTIKTTQQHSSIEHNIIGNILVITHFSI